MILTGKGDETDRILGLELAADDYLMKPFNPRELLARVRALLRRAGGEFPAARNGGDLVSRTGSRRALVPSSYRKAARTRTDAGPRRLRACCPVSSPAR